MPRDKQNLTREEAIEQFPLSEWFRILISSNYETLLPEVQLKFPDGVTLTGSGRLLWDAESGARIQFCTNNPDGFDPLVRDKIPIGRLMQDADLSEVSGCTSDGCSFRTKGIPEFSQFHPTHRWLDWTIEAPTMTLLGEEPYHPPFDVLELQALINDYDFTIWSYSSYMSPDVPEKRMWRYKMVELMCETKNATVTLSDLGNERAVVRIVPRNLSETDLWEAFENTYAALCFVSGKKLPLLGWEVFTGRSRKKTQRRLPKGPITPMYPPFGYGGTSCLTWNRVEEPLTLAIDFLSTAKGSRVRGLLYVWWDCADVMPAVSILVLCSLIEGLIKMLREPKVSRTSAARLLREFRKSGLYGVSEEDVLAFERRRNPAAHGEFSVDEKELEGLVVDQARLACLFNRLVLTSMGYSGPIKRYDLPGWPIGSL